MAAALLASPPPFLLPQRRPLPPRSSSTRIPVILASQPPPPLPRRPPVEERFRIQVEKSISRHRQLELGVPRWSRWTCGKCLCTWEWKVNELVYIVKGSMEVTPDDCEDTAYFYAGDLVRFPKWLSAELTFREDCELRYRFLAYGDE